MSMRVLVLGSTGFLGRLLVDELRRAGDVVEAWSRSADDRPRSGSRRVDLELDALPLPVERWDAAVLLAGPSVPRTFDARDASATIAIAERALAHLARHARGARVVVASSAHVLAPTADPLPEDAPLAPRGAYGAAKAAVEALAHARAGELDVVVARLFGSLGPGQPRGLFVPDLLEALARREPVVALAGPDASRDLTDGRDVARALRALVGTRDLGSRTFHVGTGRATRLSEIAARTARATGSSARVEFAPGEGPTSVADSTRIRARTGWEPREDLDSTIAWIASGSALAPRRDA